MSIPKDRAYLKTHEWVQVIEGDVLVGITEFAQEQLGDLVFVGDFTVGAQLAAGDVAGIVESVKAASDIYAPVAGTIVAVNQQVLDAPELLNEQPYEAWIYRFTPNAMADVEALLTAEQYDDVKND